MTEKPEGTWESHIGKLEIKVGDSVEDVKEIPVFGWSYKKMIYGGDIHAYPHTGIFLFQTRRGDYSDPGYTGNLKGVLEQVEKFGWGKPPKIDEVYADIQKASGIAKSDGLKEFLEYCKELEKNWATHLE